MSVQAAETKGARLRTRGPRWQPLLLAALDAARDPDEELVLDLPRALPARPAAQQRVRDCAALRAFASGAALLPSREALPRIVATPRARYWLVPSLTGGLEVEAFAVPLAAGERPLALCSSGGGTMFGLWLEGALLARGGGEPRHEFAAGAARRHSPGRAYMRADSVGTA